MQFSLPYTSCAIPFTYGLGVFHVGDKYLKEQGYKLQYVVENHDMIFDPKDYTSTLINDNAIIALGHADLLHRQNELIESEKIFADLNYKVVVDVKGKVLYIVEPFEIPVSINDDKELTTKIPHDKNSVLTFTYRTHLMDGSIK